jgi:hypothetical protein
LGESIALNFHDNITILVVMLFAEMAVVGVSLTLFAKLSDSLAGHYVVQSGTTGVLTF